MMWGSNAKLESKRVLISLTEREARLFLVEYQAGNVKVVDATTAEYSGPKALEATLKDWQRNVKIKGLCCDWLLSRSLYKTFSLAAPKVPDTELNKTIKWLIKDQLEESLDSVLVSFYKPFSLESDTEKLVAVSVDKEFIESLIEVTANLNLQLNSIQINELAAGNAISSLENDEQIRGLIDEDHQGLIFNFYRGQSLAFTRHIRGRFFPNQADNGFSLDADDSEEQTDRFLLETQRTLDYCISQFFRAPVNRLTLNATKTENNQLLESLEQIAELPVDLISLDPQASGDSNNNIVLSIAEAGATIGGFKPKNQWIDFYLPQYRPKPLEFGFNYALGLCGVAVIGLLVYGLLQSSELSQVEQTLQSSDLKLTETQTAMQQVSQKLGIVGSKQNLDQQISVKQTELIASRKLLNKVEQTSPTKPVLYSEVLAALSKQKAKSLWLTQIKLSPYSIELAGQTTLPESIPSYIKQMSSNEILSSQFENLKIERSSNNNKLVEFFMTNGRYYHAE